MKYLLAASTFLLVIAFSEVEALDCYNCIYNISQGAPVNNPRCKDPFDYDMMQTQTCTGDQVCAKYPAFLGDNTGSFLVSLERKCAADTGNGCIKFEDAQGGYLKICGYFCYDDKCNSAGTSKINFMAVFLTLVFAMLVVFQ
ncbi:uncharacterized protein [Amphiura filiformis]|uniref:uncharacterized protein n=1 Tax=Amphiura filiformis TaxID=82378 RepID=UPI003B2239F4